MLTVFYTVINIFAVAKVRITYTLILSSKISPHYSTFEVGRFGRGITTSVFDTGEALSNEYRKFSQ